MARARGRGDSGWPAALGGALLLVALGFVLGMVAGIAIEAPGLLVDHLAGRSTEVPLAPGGPGGAGAADAAAAPGAASPAANAPAGRAAPSADSRRTTASSTARRATATSRRPPAAAPAQRTAATAPRTAATEPRRAAPRSSAPPAGRFSVQVSAFGRADSARNMADALRADGVPAQVVDTRSGSARYKVRVGPLATKAEAQRMAQRLTLERGLDTWVVAGERR